ncbi:MAG TPA: GYD domain-containing protein [Stellaceae bacterium]|nr:GYD domain-containing protein [Stellaceae bacterium]
MPKYLIKARYTAQGLKGLQEEGGTRRKESISNALSALGGKLEAMYFAMGDDDVVVIADAPDNAAIAAVGIAVSATGSVRTETVALLTPEEIDKAVKHKINYRPPGR